MVMHDDWTAERARALPDDGMRHEVLDGVLAVTPAPSFGHQRAGFILARMFDDYLTPHQAGLVLAAPAAVDTDARAIERWRPGDERPEPVEGVIRWQPVEDVPPLELDHRTLCNRALGPA